MADSEGVSDPSEGVSDETEVLSPVGDDLVSNLVNEIALVITNNEINIVNNITEPQHSPDEEIIKSRGRKPINHRLKHVNSPELLVTRKSPRKVANTVDFASYFFKSPTPKKTPTKYYRYTPIRNSKKGSSSKTSFRKRLSLSNCASSGTSFPSTV
ncbi:hypothetical protein HDE_02393 [Halotydeus destructor]|nr:hypothetical protein HDE_02393 [Halotydeus destructor]